MPSEVIVMPSWQADRYSSMCSTCLRTSAAPRRPSSRSCSSAPLRRAHERELRRDEESVQGDQDGDAEQEEQLRSSLTRASSGYFEEDRRRSCADAANVAVSPSASIRRASSKSPSVRPPSLCVVIVTVTVFHEISRSG